MSKLIHTTNECGYRTQIGLRFFCTCKAGLLNCTANKEFPQGCPLPDGKSLHTDRNLFGDELVELTPKGITPAQCALCAHLGEKSCSKCLSEGGNQNLPFELLIP